MVLIICPIFAVLYTLWGVRALINHKTVTFDAVVLFTDALIVWISMLMIYWLDGFHGDRLVHLLPPHVSDQWVFHAFRHFALHLLQVF